jgi:putative glutamine amidotransferase
VVAVTTTAQPSADPAGRGQLTLPEDYVTALEGLGLTTVLITPAHPPHSIRALIERCSGLVLTGGEDVEPARYGETPAPGLGAVNPARDAMELEALRHALERRLPVLGICRGCQVLNVFFGGTLYQDLDTQRPGRVRHCQTESGAVRTHPVRVQPGSRLASILGLTDVQINSFHHQAVKDLGAGLEATAFADDGLIEAIEATDYPWVIGVQWHPERNEATAAETDPDHRLLAAFATAVLRRQEES